MRRNEKAASCRASAYPLFVGFESLDAWTDAIDARRPVYALPLIEPDLTGRAICRDNLIVICQQVAPDGSVLYCRMKAGHVTRGFTEPTDAMWRTKRAGWQLLWRLVSGHLRVGLKLTVIPATIAMPSTLIPLEGRSDLPNRVALNDPYRLLGALPTTEARLPA